ncbi:MAG: hypothetical protein C0415_05175 [Thermodesulfovibrio sp.]|nr:hypothetical protein [Thermodesulfovibrio sp.]
MKDEYKTKKQLIAEEALQKNSSLLKALSHAQSQFIANIDTHVLFDELLNQLITLTQSEYGYIGEVLYSSEGKPYVKTNAITNIAWNEETRKLYEKFASQGMELHNLKNLIGAVLITGKPVISNNPSTDPRRGGLPEGHPPLNAFLGMPLYKSGKLIGTVGIANRPNGYDEDLIEFLQPFLITCANIIEAHRIDQQRKLSEKEMTKLSMAIEQASDWVVITDSKGNIEYANKAVEEITGYKRDELIGQNPRIFKSGKHDEQFYKKMWDTILSGLPYRIIITNRKKNGELFEIYHTITPLKNKKGEITHFVSTAKDMTQQKLMEEKINYLAYYDTLTNLPNRSLFNDRVKQAVARAEYNKKLIAVLLVDIDRFTFINDTFGADVGDEVLKEVGKRLSNSVREGDTVARLGSDEFGISLIDIAQSSDIVLILKNIMKNIRQPIKIVREDLIITACIGISIYPADAKDSPTLVKNAEIALTKVRGMQMNNYQFYTSDMNVRASEFLLMEKNLFDALKNGEFIIYYQPYFDINTGEITGMEALLRWNSPALGLLPPSRFIPPLEETGMIIDVGEWILKTVCSQIKDWQNKGYSVVPVSVNLSPVQFSQRDLEDVLERHIKESGINPKFITFEITESAFMQDIEFTKSVLEKLKKIGISVSIDDFGTGYSSLSYLKRFPVDNLKIDISFIRDIATDPDSASIVTAIISMAHGLGIKTIAEGVETEEQWKILRILRCDIMQGFYRSRPLPAEDVEKMLNK